MSIGHPASWVVPSDIASRVVLNPKAKRQSGRPMEGRHTSSSERTTTQSCRRCGQPGHNSKRCSNSLMVNEGPSRIVPKEYRCKCSICHKIGHNKQTCPEKDCTMEWMEPLRKAKCHQKSLQLRNISYHFDVFLHRSDFHHFDVFWLIYCSEIVLIVVLKINRIDFRHALFDNHAC